MKGSGRERTAVKELTKPPSNSINFIDLYLFSLADITEIKPKMMLTIYAGLMAVDMGAKH